VYVLCQLCGKYGDALPKLRWRAGEKTAQGGGEANQQPCLNGTDF